MSSQPIDPFRGFRFRFEVLGIHVGGFSEVTVPDVSVATVDYREGHEVTHVRTLSGLTSYGRVSLRTGLTTSTVLYDWHNRVVQYGSSAPNVRLNASIYLMDTDGSPAVRWDLTGTWPTKYQTSGLKAATSEVMIETLELAIESMVRAK
jgi:phage tail-like protein